MERSGKREGSGEKTYLEPTKDKIGYRRHASFFPSSLLSTALSLLTERVGTARKKLSDVGAGTGPLET